MFPHFDAKAVATRLQNRKDKGKTVEDSGTLEQGA
jgi:hypothetical protein